jgi:ABC-type transporter Mla subunit MlaD
MVVTLGLFPLAVMLALLFAAVWISEGQRERETDASRSRD